LLDGVLGGLVGSNLLLDLDSHASALQPLDLTASELCLAELGESLPAALSIEVKRETVPSVLEASKFDASHLERMPKLSRSVTQIHF
jgi:hypothetical protein